MKILHFEGYSDDTFGENRVFHVDHDDCAQGTLRVFRVESIGDEEAVLVTGQYGAWSADVQGPGTWRIGVQNATDEDGDEIPIPGWNIRLVQGYGHYSPRLAIDAPDDVQVSLVHPKE